MAQFYNKILKKEEEFGGYNTGEPDDDIFKLGTSDYPGDLSKFLVVEPVVVEEIISEPEINIDELKDSFDEGSIWDNFEIENQDEPPTESEDLLHTLNLSDKLNEQLDNEIIDPLTLESANINQPNEEELTFDDEFKQRLASLIRPDKEEVKENKILETEETNFKPQDFKPVEDIANANFIDISNFDISRASEKPLNEFSPDINSEIKPEIKPEKKSEIKPDIKPEIKPEEQQKEKRKFPLILVGILAASIILLSVAAFYIYNLVFLKPKTDAKITLLDSTKKEVKKELKKESHKELLKEEKSKPNSDTIAKAKKIDTVNQTKVIGPTIEKKVEKETVKKTEVPAITRIEKKPVIEKPKKTAIEKKKVEKIVKIEPKKIEKKPKAVKEIVKVDKKEKIISKAKEKKKDIAINKNIENKESKPKSQTETISNTEKIIKIAVYTVQVYSSPSKEDALEWLNKLKGKNISDAVISEQMVRDVKWYRVRFGQFESREQARSAALRYGFAQTWIDRVK